jgi:hypothetical protein
VLGFGKMGTILMLMILLCLTTTSHGARIIEKEEEEFYSKPNWNNNDRNSRRVMDVKGCPESVMSISVSTALIELLTSRPLWAQLSP